MKVKSENESEVAQSCPTLSNPMDCSPPGSSVRGICQARVLEWGAIAFSICHHRVYLNLHKWNYTMYVSVWFALYIFLRFSHFAIDIYHLFLWVALQNTEYVKIFINCPIHSHKDCLKFGAVMNKDFINILFFFFFSFYYYFFFIFTLFYFTILYWFCHTLTWIHHGCTCDPKHEPFLFLWAYIFYFSCINT